MYGGILCEIFACSVKLYIFNFCTCMLVLQWKYIFVEVPLAILKSYRERNVNVSWSSTLLWTASHSKRHWEQQQTFFFEHFYHIDTSYCCWLILNPPGAKLLLVLLFFVLCGKFLYKAENPSEWDCFLKKSKGSSRSQNSENI
jgi:hypothetical protein